MAPPPKYATLFLTIQAYVSLTGFTLKQTVMKMDVPKHALADTDVGLSQGDKKCGTAASSIPLKICGLELDDCYIAS